MNRLERSFLSLKFGAYLPLTVSSGATSNSQQLQSFINGIFNDTAELKAFATLAQNAYLDLSEATSASALGIQNMVSSLSSRASSLSSSGMALISMHSSSQVVTGDTTCSISTVFGQATLPVLEETDLLNYTDLYGLTRASSDIRVWTAQSSGSAHSLNDYKEAPNSELFIECKQPLVEELETISGTKRYLWVRIDIPYGSQYKAPTCLEIYPLPAFACNIEEIGYLTAEASNLSTWTTLDLSYLPGYNQDLYSNAWVNNAGPLRVFMPGTVVSAIRIKLSADENIVMGLGKVRLLSQTFDNTGVLKVTNPWGLDISTLALKGKDLLTLSELPVVINNTDATITLSRQSTGVTPVITGVLIQEQS